MNRRQGFAILTLCCAQPLAAQEASPTLHVLAIREYIALRHSVVNTPVSLIVCVDINRIALDPRRITPSGYPQPNLRDVQITPPCDADDPWPLTVIRWPALRIHGIAFFTDSIVFSAVSGLDRDQRILERGVLDRAGDRITPRYLWVAPAPASVPPPPTPAGQPPGDSGTPASRAQ